MFQRVKNNYEDVAVCRSGDNEGTYSFIESYDDDWGEIASEKFREEFGENPREMELVSRTKI